MLINLLSYFTVCNKWSGGIRKLPLGAPPLKLFEMGLWK